MYQATFSESAIGGEWSQGMAMAKHRHMSPAEVERYSLGTVPETDLAPLEEHLLICEQCRSLVEQSDAYIAAIRGAAEAMQTEESDRKPAQTERSISFKHP